MIEAEIERIAGQRSERAVEIRVTPHLENVGVIRTLVGAVGTFEDLDVDTVADLRLAVDELCTQLIRAATADATLTVVVDPRDDALVVQAFAACENDDVLRPGSFSWHVVSSLADEATILRDGAPSAGGGLFGVALTTWRAGAAQ